MAEIILPYWSEVSRQREQYANASLGNALYWDARVKEVDPKLSIAWVDEKAPRLPGITPGRWHVLRDNSETGAANSYMPIVGPNGEYREPASDIITALRERDLWNEQANERRRADEEAKARADARDDERQREDRIGEIAEGIKQIETPSVAFTDTKWTASAKGRKP